MSCARASHINALGGRRPPVAGRPAPPPCDEAVRDLTVDDATATRVALDLLQAAREGEDAFRVEVAALAVKCAQVPEHPLNSAEGTAVLLWVMSQMTLHMAERWQGALPQYPGLLDEFLKTLRADVAGG